jgi:hypothetical protein
MARQAQMVKRELLKILKTSYPSNKTARGAESSASVQNKHQAFTKSDV